MNAQPQQNGLSGDQSATGAPSISSADATGEQYDALLKSHHEFWKVLQDLLKGNKFTPAAKDHDFYTKSALTILNKFDVRQDAKTGFVYLDSKANSSSIEINPTRVTFVSKDVKKEFNMEIAMAMAWAAAQNKTLIQEGIELLGTQEHQHLLQLAVLAVNKAHPPEQQLKIKNHMLFDEKHVPDFKAYVETNAPQFKSPKSAQPAAPPVMDGAKQEKNPNVSIVDAAISAIENFLNEDGYAKSTEPEKFVEKTNAFPKRNVYMIDCNVGGDQSTPVKAYYVMKDKKAHIIAMDMDGERVMRDAEIFMNNDLEHPKYKAPKSAAPDFEKAAAQAEQPTAPAPAATPLLDPLVLTPEQRIFSGAAAENPKPPHDAVADSAEGAVDGERLRGVITRMRAPAPQPHAA